MPSTRPTRSDPRLRAEVIAKLAEDCAAWDMDGAPTPSCIEGWVSALGRCHLNDNGYELARDLECYHHVSPDAELVEILDSASSYIWTAHDKLVAAWVAESGIKPTLEAGQRAECRHGAGTILRIEEASGRYVFVPDAEAEKFGSTGGYLIAYEDMQPEQVSA